MSKKDDKEQKDKNDGEEDFDPMAQMNKNMNLMFPVIILA